MLLIALLGWLIAGVDFFCAYNRQCREGEA